MKTKHILTTLMALTTLSTNANAFMASPAPARAAAAVTVGASHSRSSSHSNSDTEKDITTTSTKQEISDTDKVVEEAKAFGALVLGGVTPFIALGVSAYWLLNEPERRRKKAWAEMLEETSRYTQIRSRGGCGL